MKRAAIYVRVSTEDQAKEGFSISAQLERLRAYCKSRGWEIFKEYVDDGYSGRTTKRPAYKKMLEEIDSWDVLLVLKMDRIHRNSRNFMEMMDLLRKKGKEFVSMMESLDTSTAIGRFVVDIIQRIAQLESEQIGERVYIGMEQKAKTPSEKLENPYLGSPEPFGYRYENGMLITVEEEANVVKRIFKMYLDGYSANKIAEILNSKNIKTKKGKKWHRKTVLGILKNPIYCGYIKWNGVVKKAPHKPIVSVTTFNKVQRIIAKKGKKKDVILIK